MPLQRRRLGHVRFPVRVPALMVEAAKPWDTPTPGETRNISRGGVRLRVEGAAIASDQVVVTLRLASHLPPTLAGTVVWSSGQPDTSGRDLGIQFAAEIPRRLVAEIAYEGFRGSAEPAE